MVRPSLVTAHQSGQDADGRENSGDRERGAEAGQERVLNRDDLYTIEASSVVMNVPRATSARTVHRLKGPTPPVRSLRAGPAAI